MNDPFNEEPAEFDFEKYHAESLRRANREPTPKKVLCAIILLNVLALAAACVWSLFS